MPRLPTLSQPGSSAGAEVLSFVLGGTTTSAATGEQGRTQSAARRMQAARRTASFIDGDSR